MNAMTPSPPIAPTLQVPEPKAIEPLCQSVRRAVGLYLEQLEGHRPPPLYPLVIAEVERPLLETVLAFVRGNQSRAAEYLGINRTTLRKKLRQYGLIEAPDPGVAAPRQTTRRIVR